MGGFKQESGDGRRALMLETPQGVRCSCCAWRRDPRSTQGNPEERKSLDQRFSDLHVSMNHQRLLSKWRFWLRRTEVRPWFCIANKLHGDAALLDLEPHFESKVRGEPLDPDSSVGKESTCNAGDPRSIPGLGRSPEEGKGYHSSILALQFHGLYSIVHGVTKSWTQLSDFHFTSLQTQYIFKWGKAC